MTCAIEGCNQPMSATLEIQVEEKKINVPVCNSCELIIEYEDCMRMRLVKP